MRIQEAHCKIFLCFPIVSGGRAAEAPGWEEGARAWSCSESSDQRASGTSRWRRQGAAADAPERLTGATAGGGEDRGFIISWLLIYWGDLDSVSREWVTKESLRLCLSGQAQRGGEDELEEKWILGRCTDTKYENSGVIAHREINKKKAWKNAVKVKVWHFGVLLQRVNRSISI